MLRFFDLCCCCNKKEDPLQTPLREESADDYSGIIDRESWKTCMSRISQLRTLPSPGSSPQHSSTAPRTSELTSLDITMHT